MTPAPEQTVQELLEELSKEILSDAMGDGIAIGVKLDALKAVAPYFIGAAKAGIKPKDDEGATNFKNMKKAVQ